MKRRLTVIGLHFILHPSSLILSLWRLRRGRRGLGRGRRAARVVGGGRLLLLRLLGGVNALAQAVDLGVGGGDRRFETRAARGEQLQLLVDAQALALELLRDGVAHGRGVERADERGAALDGLGLRLVGYLGQTLLQHELLVGYLAQLPAQLLRALLGARQAFEVVHRALVNLHLVELARQLLDLRREVAHRAAQLLVLGLRGLPRRGAPRRAARLRRRLRLRVVGGADDGRLVGQLGR